MCEIAASLQKKDFRYPLQHRVASLVRMVRFWPPVTHFFARGALAFVLFSRASEFYSHRESTYELNRIAQLDTQLGRVYRKALAQVAPHYPALQQYQDENNNDIDLNVPKHVLKKSDTTENDTTNSNNNNNTLVSVFSETQQQQHNEYENDTRTSAVRKRNKQKRNGDDEFEKE